MKTEILSIGTELTTGQNLDTNSQWLSLKLAEIGIPVGWHTTIADDLSDNLEAVRIAVQRAQLVIITGGLGPTLDDLTREVLAKAAGVELVLHEPSLTHIQSLFSRRQRTMPERNRVQAYLPAGAEPLENPLGTAPGIWMRIGQTFIAAMPGVPSEMFAMYEAQVKPRLLKLGLGRGVRMQRKINTFAAGESQIEELLGDVTRRGAVPEVGITAHDAVVSLRIFGSGATLEEAHAQIAPVEQVIRQRLGNFVFGVDQEELQDVVIRLLGEKKKSLATAESITGGLVAQRLVQIAGASNWFRGGIVAYDSRVKVSMVDVPKEMIDRHSAVSPEVAQALAVGCRRRLGADIGVGTTGYAGPTAAEDQPVGLAYLGLAWDGGVLAVKVNWLGTRTEIQSRTAKSALNLVRLHLMERC
jgi:nicotinamide-nucleotide amidase